MPLGHRKRLLKAIANFGVTEQTAAGARTPTRPSTNRQQPSSPVMFSDLVGSTALSVRLDPEDLREVISAYQKRVARDRGRLGGFIAKYMGDGVLVYFGYPHAHEDDAERAVRAGLEWSPLQVH